MDKFIMDDTYINRQADMSDYNSIIKAAYESGLEKGYTGEFLEEYVESFIEGFKEGEEKALRLIKALYKAGRQDEIAKLYADKTFRENLYKEFNII